MKIRNVLIAIFLLGLANMVMQPILAQGRPVENASLRAPSNETELISFVEFAVAHVNEVGKDKAIKDFMDLNGSWVREMFTSSPMISMAPLYVYLICPMEWVLIAWILRITRVFTLTERCNPSP